MPNKINPFSGLSKETIEQMSEKGTVWIFNRALINNIRYNSIEDIKRDPKFNELKKIWRGSVPDAWLLSYYKQQEEMLKKFGSSEWSRFKYGSGSFMDFIKDVLRTLNINSENKLRYEQWNPTDIWMIKKNSITKIKRQISKNIKRRSQTIIELNDLLRSLIKNKELIGISLKKIGTGDAKFIYINVDIDGVESLVRDNTNINVVSNIEYSLDQLQCKVEFDGGDKIQITNNTGQNKPDNLKFEVIIKKSGGKGGKVVIKDLSDLMKNYGKNFSNNYKRYPLTSENYERNKNEYKQLVNILKQKKVISSNISFNEFDDAILNLYENDKPYYAITKLMELKFLSAAIQINDQNEFWTDMYYLGLKVGNKFAPHGKLY